VKIIIYDCEIKRGIPARGEEKIPGIEYCRGWGDHEGMGVSVTGVYDYAEDRYRVFCDDNVGEMLVLFAEADLLVGFNSLRFDDKLLEATYDDFRDITTPRYDILVEIWRAAGLKPSWGSPKTHGGFGLGDMCETNFDEPKSGHGAMAPVDWQRGNIGAVIDYCLHDIYMTKMLMDLVISGTPVVSPKGGLLNLLVPSGIGNHTEDQVIDEPEGEGVQVDISEHQRSEAVKTFPAQKYAEGMELKWDDLLIEVEQLPSEDRVMVAVHTNDGLLIRRKLMLHEWSCEELNSAFLNKDAPTIVRYLRANEDLYRRIGDVSGDVI